MKNLFFILLASLYLLSSCQQPLKEGEFSLQVNGGKIWYKVMGSGDKTPIVMLHGGPGYPSYYLTPLFELSKDRTVITYDQLGCGRSDMDIDTAYMNVNSHVEDLSKLVDALQLKEFYLYGHSYGTTLAVEYYMKHKSNVKGIILASPCLNAKKWELDADTLMSSLDSTTASVLQDSKKGIINDTALFKKSSDIYYSTFYHRKTNAYLDSSRARSGRKMYIHMWGPEEFIVTGNLKNYNSETYLNQITVPTLFTTGEFDAARPNTVKYFQSLVKNAEFVLIKNASHSTMNDNTEEDLKTITNFLNKLDNGSLK